VIYLILTVVSDVALALSCHARSFSLLVAQGVDEGAFVGTDYYKAHLQVQLKPPHFLVITDRWVCRMVGNPGHHRQVGV